MLLNRLEVLQRDGKVVLLQTPSIKLQQYIMDYIKRVFYCQVETIIQCKSSKDYKYIKDIMHIIPPFSDKWFIEVDLEKCNDKDMLNLMKDAKTCIFFCKVDRYVTYKRVKDELKGLEGVYDFYLNHLRKADFVYLYDAYVSEEHRIKHNLFQYVVQSYSGDIDAVLQLFEELEKGTRVEKRSDIVDICGLGGNTLESFVFSLLKDPPTMEKGIKVVTKNRLKAMYELSDIYKYSDFYIKLKYIVKSLIDIKMLMVNGVIYTKISKLPECYNEKALVKYQRNLWKIKEIPMSRLIRLYNSLGVTIWSNELDILTFLCNYLMIEIVNNE